MIRFLIFLMLCNLTLFSFSQELFVYTEPASNMPSKSLGFRLMNSFMSNKDKTINYHAMPELMVGLNKNFMFHTQAFLSNRNNSLVAEGASLYAKYRWLSKDDVHQHFRVATYGRYSFNNSDIHQDEIETMGHNSGFEIGFIATQLYKKFAYNASISVEKAFDNTSANKFPSAQSNQAINYTLSIGKLVLPKKYINYHQTNFNVMIELLGQTLAYNKKTFIDIAPSFQFIFNSISRLDIAYRKQLYSSMLRTAPNGLLLKFEYNLFNVLK